jgi:xylulokinase
VIYDLAGNVLPAAAAHGAFPPNPEHPEWTVWQPEQIWGGTAEAMQEAVSNWTTRADQSCGCDGMGMDGVPVDEAGNWLYPFISWHDPRTEAAAALVGKSHRRRENLPHGRQYLMALQHRPAAVVDGRARARYPGPHRQMAADRRFPEFHAVRPPGNRLHHGFLHALVRPTQTDWSQEILAQAGIDRRLLCDAFPSGTLLGEVTARCCRSDRAAGWDAGGAGRARLFVRCAAGGRLLPGRRLDVTGTWEIVLAAIPAPVLTPEVQKLGVTVETHVARDTYAVWGGAVAADMLEWYRKEYGFEAQQRAKEKAGWTGII